MKFKVLTIPPFDKQLKRLSKKFPSIKSEVSLLIDKLESEPQKGTPLGNNCYKIRIPISYKGKGRSRGGRVITYLQVINETVLLITIYDKSERQTITDKELKLLLSDILTSKKK